MRDAAIVLGIIGIGVVWRRPAWVWWWTALAAVALEVIHHWYGGIGQYFPVVGGIVGALIAFLPRRDLWRFLWQHRVQYWGFLFYTLAVWVSLAVSINRHVSVRYALGVPAIFWLTALVIPYLLHERQMTVQDLLKPMALAGVLFTLVAAIGAIGFHQGFLVPVGHHHLLAWEWPFANKNTLGMLLVFATPAALGLYLDERTPNRGMYGIGFLISLIGVVFSYARASWIATIVGVMLLIVLRYRGRGLLGVVIGVVVLAGGAVMATGVHKWEKLWSHGLSGRTGLWQAALKVAAKHPWFGVGAGNSPAAILPYVPPAYRGLSPHDSILRTLVELGAVGLILWGIVVVVALYKAFFTAPQRHGWTALALGAVLLASLVEQGAESVFLGGVFFGDLFFTVLVGVAWLLPSLGSQSRLGRMR